MSTPRCLVLGAGGFIGRNLCRTLIERGIPVTGFGRATAAPRCLPDLPWRTGVIERLDDADWLVAGHTHLFDLIAAGSPGGSERNPAQILAGGMRARARLLAACRRQRVERIVFASSGGTVYGAAGAAPIREDAATRPISAYGMGKLAVERYLEQQRRLHGLDHRILRIGNAYGPHQLPLRGQGLVATVLFRLLRDEPVQLWGDGGAIRDYIHIDDVVSAMLAAAFSTDPATRLCNVGSGIGRDVLSVIADAAEVLGRTARIERLPGRPADVPCNVLDASRLGMATGWAPRVEWRDGLTRTAGWLLSAMDRGEPALRHATPSLVSSRGEGSAE